MSHFPHILIYVVHNICYNWCSCRLTSAPVTAVSVDEESPTGSAITTVVASDADVGDVVQFEFTQAYSQFEIDASKSLTIYKL
jgi:hypothetical protein